MNMVKKRLGNNEREIKDEIIGAVNEIELSGRFISEGVGVGPKIIERPREFENALLLFKGRCASRNGHKNLGGGRPPRVSVVRQELLEAWRLIGNLKLADALKSFSNIEQRYPHSTVMKALKSLCEAVIKS